MQSVFETAPTASVIPITFVTKATWEAAGKELPREARRFASANDFTGKPGKCLTLPSADGSCALYCAVIVKKVDARTRAKTSLNELLRGD